MTMGLEGSLEEEAGSDDYTTDNTEQKIGYDFLNFKYEKIYSRVVWFKTKVLFSKSRHSEKKTVRWDKYWCAVNTFSIPV